MPLFVRDLFSILIQIFLFLGYGGAAVCLLWFGVLRIARGPWVSVKGVVADGILYWYAHDGPVRQRDLSPNERDLHPDDTHLPVHYRTRRGFSTSFQRQNADEHLLVRLGWLFGGLGVVSSVASVVMLFLPAPERGE